jgi:tRNA(fMet)-specific endonuclease VapC
LIALLDTNVFIALMREPLEFQKFATIMESGQWREVYMSSITLFELEMGVLGRIGEAIARQRLSALLSGPIAIVPFTKDAAIEAARIATQARQMGRQLSAIDALIAGHAIALGATLVTSDAKLAGALDGIEVVNWR